MSDEAASGRGVEKAIYLVGGLGLGLFGIQELAATSVSIYGVMYDASGRNLNISPGTWAGWAAGVVVGVMFLLGGLYLLSRTRRLGGFRASSVSAPMTAPP